MRLRAAALVGSLLTALSIAALPVSPTVGVAAAATTQPKVVIIVGATEGSTSTYRKYADAEATEALKYTSNVVKVYSPNATWSAVKQAVVGANIVIYHGHGNGWPSPYTYDPLYTTKDGFGLNKVAGAGDSNKVYYGEPYIDGTKDAGLTTMAPNAIVLLGNLCYASGDSELGDPEPSVSVAKQRADNYASAFLRAGASAVIADGHMGLGYYVRAVLTTHQTVDQLWRAAPNFHNHVISYASSRTAGANARLDPENTSTAFYRSVVGNLSTTTDAIASATGADASEFVAPGAVAVSAVTPVDGTAIPRSPRTSAVESFTPSPMAPAAATTAVAGSGPLTAATAARPTSVRLAGPTTVVPGTAPVPGEPTVARSRGAWRFA